MRIFAIAAAIVFLLLSFNPVEAKPDTGLSAAFETYLTNRLHSETVIAQRELNHEEICGVLIRAVESFRKEVKRGSGRNFEEHLTYESLLHLRMIERDCKRHASIKPKRFKEGDEPAIVDVNLGGFAGISDLDDPVDDPLEAEALRDFMKWHPDEFEAKNAEEAGDYAVLEWEVSERARELKAQLEEAEHNAINARDQVRFGHNRGAAPAEIKKLEANAHELEGKVNDLKSQISDECVKARDDSIAQWVFDNVPVGTAEDMTPKTTSGETRNYTDDNGNKVTEYDNGARGTVYPDGREVTVEPDGTRITEFPDGHVVREDPDSSIEYIKDHPDGVLRIVVQPDGETDYYLNGIAVAHYWPDLFPNRLVRHVDYIDPETGLTPVERYSPMRWFWHWISGLEDENEPDVDRDDEQAVARYLLDSFAAFKAAHPDALDDETFEEFVDRRFFELFYAHVLINGDGLTAAERREIYRIILTEWEDAHPEATMTLTDLIAKRKLEADLENGTVSARTIPLGLDVEGLREELQAYNDWLEAHPDRTQDEERERRQHAARLRYALEFQRRLYEGSVAMVGGEENLRRLVGDDRFRAMKAAYESLPKDVPDKHVGGSVDPLDPNWPGRKPQTAQAVFSSLNGLTRVNGALLPDANETTLTIIGVDGEEYAAPPELARADNAGDDILVFVSPTVELSGVVLRGGASTVILRQVQSAPMQSAVSPLDGVVNMRNGQLSETLRVSPTLTDINALAATHNVTIGQGLTPAANAQAGVVALQEGEIAIYVENVDTPTLGTTECAIEGPNGQTASAAMPAWSYDIQPQPVAAVNTWAPIFFMVAGLPADEKLRVTFAPPPGVDTEPDKTKVKVGDFVMMRQIARYRTSIVGPQPIGARIERLD